MNRLGEALKIRPGEGRVAALVIAMMLLTSAGGSMGGNGIEAVFFSRFGTRSLPYLYVALGLVTFATSLAVTALFSRLSRARLYLALPLVLALVLVAERVIVPLGLNWFYPAMWLGMNVMVSLQGLLTWGLAGSVTDTRQAKRLFPLFNAGRILGAVAGGLGTRSLVSWLHAENLLLVWAGALAFTFVLARVLIGESNSASLRRPAAKSGSRLVDEIQIGYRFVRRSPLMRWMSVAAVLFSVLYFSLALPFARAATAQFPNEDALAGFLGIFQGLSTGAAFLASLFLANRLFARFGFMSMTLAFPIIYLAGFASLAALAVFPVLVAFRFVQMLWLSGIADSAYQGIVNVVPTERRDQVRAFVEGVPGQAGIAIAGVILVVGEQSLQPRQLYFIGLGAAALTVYAVWRASRAYGQALVDALHAGQPQLFFSEDEPFGGFKQDARAVRVAMDGISNSEASVRRVSAEILGNLSVPEATDALAAALGDEDVGVRAAAIRSLARAKAAPALLEVHECLRDPEPEVRMEAVEALRQLAGYPRGLTLHLRPLLDDPDPTVRAHVAVALLKANPAFEAQAIDALKGMASSAESRTRASAMEALGECKRPEAFGMVAAGLNDSLPRVRRAAAAALVRIDAARSLDPLLMALGDDDPLVREAAAGAIGQIGEAAMERTIEALSDPALESGALMALEHLPARKAATSVREYARRSAARAIHCHGLAGGIDPSGRADDRLGLLVQSLRETARAHGVNALRAIGLLGNAASISLAVDNLRSRDPAQRANALETLESAGEREIVSPLLKLWESGEAPVPPADGWLAEVMSDRDAWLRACAATVAAGSDDPAVRDRLAGLARSDPDGLVRESAAWALNGGDSVETLPTLSTMERILFLRRVRLFADLSPADLKRVATIATERYHPDGEVIARQGEPGDEMFIIVSGEVRVVAERGHDHPVEVARRQPGEYVGEMAILSQERRVASLIAAGEVRTLCIDQRQFEGILRERPETGLAVMRELISRLREVQAHPHGHDSAEAARE